MMVIRNVSKDINVLRTVLNVVLLLITSLNRPVEATIIALLKYCLHRFTHTSHMHMLKHFCFFFCLSHIQKSFNIISRILSHTATKHFYDFIPFFLFVILCCYKTCQVKKFLYFYTLLFLIDILFFEPGY